MHWSIPAVPVPPTPRALAFSFLNNGKFPGVGINKSIKCLGLGPKKKANAPPRVHLESNTAQDLINHSKKVSLIIKTIKAGFHIITMIAAIAGKNVQQSL